jgi:murein DD-endopeptidase MepM/ murein hydrolase activator NlpD
MTSPNFSSTQKTVAVLFTFLLLGAAGAVLSYQHQVSSTENQGQDNSSSSKNSSLENKQSINNSTPSGYPLPFKKEPSSIYGWRVDPFNLQTKRHQGIDFSVPAGTSVKATGYGKVIQSSYDQANGQFIEIDHGDGYRTKYAHLKTPYVQQGQNIQLGQTIGEVGSTGRSTSAHLHYEVLYQGANINPLNVMGQVISQPALNQTANSTQSNQTPSPNLQRVLFIRNSGTEYRMVDLSKPQQF